MNATGPVDSRVFMQNRAMRKYLADRGLTAVLKPGGRQYTPKHSKVLIEAIAAGIEPLEFNRKVEREMRFNLIVHDPDTLFNIIDQQRRDQPVIEANDAARRQTPHGVTLNRWLLRRPICRATLLANITRARVPRPMG